MIWSFLIVGIVLVAFATIMFWRQIVLDEFSIGRLIFGVWIPGMIGGLMVITFLVLFIANTIKRM
jgi:uncharacterized membrane protein